MPTKTYLYPTADLTVAGRIEIVAGASATNLVGGVEYTPVDVFEDDPVTYSAPAAYAQKTFNAAFEYYDATVPLTTSRVLIGAWVSRPGSNNFGIFNMANNSALSINADGSGLYQLRDGGTTIVSPTIPIGTVPASGLFFMGFEYDLVTGLGTMQLGATQSAMNGLSGEVLPTGAMRLFRYLNSTRQYEGNFADVVMQFDGVNSLSDLYSSGPVDPELLDPSFVILGGSMTAADFNSATQLGTGTLTNGNGTPAWTEVV